MIFTRSSVIRKILVLKIQENIQYKSTIKLNFQTVDIQINDQRMFE
jgi:hypothetical protein